MANGDLIMPIRDESLTPIPTKMVEVPQHVLDQIEVARQDLYNMFLNTDMDIHQQVRLQNITDPMWRVANTKWKVVK